MRVALAPPIVSIRALKQPTLLPFSGTRDFPNVQLCVKLFEDSGNASTRPRNASSVLLVGSGCAPYNDPDAPVRLWSFSPPLTGPISWSHAQPSLRTPGKQQPAALSLFCCHSIPDLTLLHLQLLVVHTEPIAANFQRGRRWAHPIFLLPWPVQ